MLLRCSGLLPAHALTGSIDRLFPRLPSRTRTIISAQCVEGSTEMQTYAVGRAALEQGAIQGRDLSLEFLMVKMMWLLGRGCGPKGICEAFAK